MVGFRGPPAVFKVYPLVSVVFVDPAAGADGFVGAGFVAAGFVAAGLDALALERISLLKSFGRALTSSSSVPSLPANS